MSNEEMAIRIRDGETEFLGPLWDSVERFVRKQAIRVTRALSGRYGVDAEDLCQCGYFAMVAAVETYSDQVGSFINWLAYYLKKAFAEATGYRTRRDKNDPLRNAVSLSTPLGGEEDDISLADVTADPGGEAVLEAVEERLWRQQLHEAMESVLGELPEDQRAVLQHRYYNQQTLAATGEVLGIKPEEARKLEIQGLRALRHYKLARKIRPFYDFDYYSGNGLGSFRSSGMSIQERYVIRMEKAGKYRE